MKRSFAGLANVKRCRPHGDLVTIELVKSILNYDPSTGIFTRKVSRGPQAALGAVLGCIGNHGYLRTRINDRHYLLHRLAWFYVHGVWPVAEIDHRDGNKLNNAIGNLREATTFQNKQNIPCEKGYNFIAKTGKYQVRMMVNGRLLLFGTYKTAEEARAVYLEAHARIHGEFSPYSLASPVGLASPGVSAAVDDKTDSSPLPAAAFNSTCGASEQSFDPPGSGSITTRSLGTRGEADQALLSRSQATAFRVKFPSVTHGSE